MPTILKHLCLAEIYISLELQTRISNGFLTSPHGWLKPNLSLTEFLIWFSLFLPWPMRPVLHSVLLVLVTGTFIYLDAYVRNWVFLFFSLSLTSYIQFITKCWFYIQISNWIYIHFAPNLNATTLLQISIIFHWGHLSVNLTLLFWYYPSRIHFLCGSSEWFFKMQSWLCQSPA